MSERDQTPGQEPASGQNGTPGQAGEQPSSGADLNPTEAQPDARQAYAPQSEPQVQSQPQSSWSASASMNAPALSQPPQSPHQPPAAGQPQPGSAHGYPASPQQAPSGPGRPTEGFGQAHAAPGYPQAPVQGQGYPSQGQGYPSQGQGYPSRPPQGQVQRQAHPPQTPVQAAGYLSRPPQGQASPAQGYPQASVPGYPPSSGPGYSPASGPGYASASGPGYAPVVASASGAVAARPRRMVWPWLVGGGAVLVVALIAVFTIPPLLATPDQPIAATPSASPLRTEPSPATPSNPTNAPTTSEPDPTATAGDLEGVFAERDAFFAAQHQPMDGSELTPKTAEQKAFIADQTAWVEQNGGAVTSQAVSIWLALAIDGCETAILNAHDVDSSIFAMHVSTSPLISTLVAQSENPDAEANLAQTMVFGMGYICPSDGEQWSALWDEAYGG